MFYTFEGMPSILHLGSPDYLSDQWRSGGLWLVPNIDPVQANGAAMRCRIIWETFREKRSFDYGLHWNGSSVDEGGNQVLVDGARGMSCSSLVLSVLNSVGVRVTDMSNWPVRSAEDLQFVETLLFMGLEQRSLDPMRGEIVRGAMRVRPDEMLAACELYPPAACFTQLTAIAEQIREALE